MSKTSKQAVERLVAHNVTETIWLRLRRLTSRNICHKLLTQRHPSLTEPELQRKADGLAWAVRSSLGYWQSQTPALNARVLSRYYALLQASIAELVASGDPHSDLERVQKHNEQGHGLATIAAPDGRFPNNYYVACLKGGHFYSYCKGIGIDLKPYAFDKRPREWDRLHEDERVKLISLSDFFRRIPELQGIIKESLDLAPLSFQVAHDSHNMHLASERRRNRFTATGKLSFFEAPAGPTTVTYAAILPASESGHTVESIASLGLPFQNISETTDDLSKQKHFIGELIHPTDELWWEHFDHYKSGYCGTSVIAPFWGGITDPFLIHLTMLYSMSIVVRYLPSLWHEIEDGELNHITSLVEYYLTIVDNVLPQIVLERITGKRLTVALPGGFDAPI